MSRLRAGLLLLVCVASASCTASYPTEPTKARAVGLLLLYAEAKGRIASPGGQYSFTAVTVDSDGAYENVNDRATWLSSDDDVMRHTARGVYRPFGTGTAQAIVRFEGFEANAPMVPVATALLEQYPRLNVVLPGTRPQAWLREGPATNQTRQVTDQASWSSSDHRVATIAANGAVTTVGIGTTLITVTYNGLTDWYWMSVGPR
jgi:hypothetical protein